MSQVIHTRFVEIAREISGELADAIAYTPPLQLTPRQDSPFSERLCRAVAGQQLSVKAAASIWSRVVDSASVQPLVDYFATVSPDTLRACGLSMAKAKAMRAIALATLANQLDEATLNELDHDARTRCLTEIWGVGQWTADMMGIFYFGDPDIWPDGDTTARKNLEKLTSRRRKTVRTAARFAPYRSYLALYMWHQADAPIV
ncbi:MAG: DNA-3-methyladenine glycosylase 2 family protein [Leptolyngbya sp. SIO3F4]|nr:DNA-3-methyladenine glycosylase 2 family protein [Leptolyngbya sp. SIO3F4]